MRNRMMSGLAVLGLLLTLSMPSPAFQRHPMIESALESLHQAKEELKHAAHDFGGHRIDAIHAIDEAERQLRICLQY